MIYLDYNATGPTLPEVANAMWPYIVERWGNPSSAYRFGAEIQNVLDDARQSVAELIGAQSDNIVFTSGGTEGNNTAIHAALAGQPGKTHLISARTEHSSVIAALSAAEAKGYRVSYLRVDTDGLIDCRELENTISPQTALVSLMWANNETGVIAPVSRIASICRTKGVAFHCDAVQAVGKVKIDFGELGLDYLTLSGHKLGAPKGIGAIAVKSTSPFVPLIAGGKQQSGRRGGTDSVPLIVALGEASRLTKQRPANNWVEIAQLRDSLEDRVLRIPGAYRNGSKGERLSNTANFGIRGIDSDGLVAFLDQNGICVSSGSACLENSLTPSHVILAMTDDYDRANEALRVSLGPTTTAGEIDQFCAALLRYPALNRSASESAGPGQSSAGIQRTKS